MTEPRRKLQSNTRIWINNQGGCDENDGLTKEDAFETPQAAWNWVYLHVDLNLNGVEFFMCGSPEPYPGLIFAYFLPGAPHDYAITFCGELQNGVALARMEDGNAGCIHVAGNCQVYARDLQAKATGSAPVFTAPYGGFLFLENVVALGAGSGPLLQAGPNGGRIDVGTTKPGVTDQPWWVSGGGSALLSAFDGGSIFIRPEATCIISNNPGFTAATFSVSQMGRIEARNRWNGSARGTRWWRQSAGLILTGQNPDTYIPGSAPGVALDGTGWCL
jgi:hypothetical protein